MPRIRARLAIMLALPLIVVGLAGCDPIASFFPDPALWKGAGETKEVVIRSVLAKAKVILTSDARINNAFFVVKTGTNKCTTSLELTTGMTGKEECNLMIETKTPYEKLTGRLILEGKVQVDGLNYEGKEESKLESE